MVKIESLPLKLACRDITRHIHFPDRVKDAIEIQVERSMLIRIDKQLVGVLCESLRPFALLDTLHQQFVLIISDRISKSSEKLKSDL